MKEKMKHVWKNCILTFVFALLFAPVCHASAASAPVCEKKTTIYFAKDMDRNRIYRGNIFVGNMKSGAKIKNVKCDNKKIEVSEEELEAYRYYSNQIPVRVKYNKFLKNNEKARISFTVVQGGKSYRLSCQITFKKMSGLVDPLSSLKIGGTEHIKKVYQFGSSAWYHVFPIKRIKGSKLKLSLKLKKNLALKKIIVSYTDDENSDGREVKNNSIIRNKLQNINIYFGIKGDKNLKYFNKNKVIKKKLKECKMTEKRLREDYLFYVYATYEAY